MVAYKNGTSRRAVKKAIATQDKEIMVVTLTKEQIQEAIRVKAYELYLERGGRPGNPVDDWIAAEKIILGNA